MAKEKVEEIDFDAIMRDTERAKAEMPKVEANIAKAISKGDPDGALTHTISLRNLGAVPSQKVSRDLEQLINTHGTAQQKVDFCVECAPVLGTSVFNTNEEIQALAKSQKAQLCGTRTLRKMAGKEKMSAMFGIMANFQAKKATRLAEPKPAKRHKESAVARTR